MEFVTITLFRMSLACCRNAEKEPFFKLYKHLISKSETIDFVNI
jgi:hypothetical protein